MEAEKRELFVLMNEKIKEKDEMISDMKDQMLQMVRARDYEKFS